MSGPARSDNAATIAALIIWTLVCLLAVWPTIVFICGVVIILLTVWERRPQ